MFVVIVISTLLNIVCIYYCVSVFKNSHKTNSLQLLKHLNIFHPTVYTVKYLYYSVF